jgi:hypothetical protein
MRAAARSIFARLTAAQKSIRPRGRSSASRHDVRSPRVGAPAISGRPARCFFESTARRESARRIVETIGTRKRAAVGIATSENERIFRPWQPISVPVARTTQTKNSLQRWATEGGAEKGAQQKSPQAARAKKKQPAKAAKNK